MSSTLLAAVDGWHESVSPLYLANEPWVGSRR
jgi:hypothetical protein